MKRWIGSQERVETKICIPSYDECHDKFVELDNLGYEVRQINSEFRYDIRYRGVDMVLFLKPAQKRPFYPVEKLTDPGEMIEAIKEKDDKAGERRRRPNNRGRGRGGATREGMRGGKVDPRKRGLEVRDTASELRSTESPPGETLVHTFSLSGLRGITLSNKT